MEFLKLAFGHCYLGLIFGLVIAFAVAAIRMIWDAGLAYYEKHHNHMFSADADRLRRKASGS